MIREIPFSPKMMDAVLNGTKTATSRTRLYGISGHLLRARCRDGRTCLIRLTRVRRLPLGVIAEQHYAAEGCDSPDDFKRVWRTLHPRAGFAPQRIVHFYTFTKEPPA